MLQRHYRELMLRRVRHTAASTVFLLLVSLAGGGFAPLLHLADCHDADCTPVVGRHAAGDHVIDQVSGSDSEPQPCVLCHLTRGFRLRPEVAPVSAPSDPLVIQVLGGAEPPLRSFVAATLPPRAPPLASFSR